MNYVTRFACINGNREIRNDFWIKMQEAPWIFEYNRRYMNQTILSKYQKNLLEIRDNYEYEFLDFDHCVFHTQNSVPSDNIFAQFAFKGQNLDAPMCKWYLFWNPNQVVELDKLKPPLTNNCTSQEYEFLCKKIQSELYERFDGYFYFIDYNIESAYHDFLLRNLDIYSIY